MYKVFLGLVLVSLAVAADSGSAVSTKKSLAKIDSAASDASVIATIRSSDGLILNGVPTPPGVNSVVVTRGDVVETLGAFAIAVYANGQSVKLAPATTYQTQPDRLVPAVTKSQPPSSRVGTFALGPVSVVKH